MNARLTTLQPYPFEKFRALTEGLTPPEHLRPISLSMGEPQQAAPDFVKTVLQENLQGLSLYPTTQGLLELRQAIADWLIQRFALAGLDPETQGLPVNGTREALFAIAQATVNAHTINSAAPPLVAMPNPFYQIYEGAALLAGAEPLFLNCTEENRFAPDFDAVTEDAWQRCQLLFICSPGNPTGAVMDIATLQKLIHLADEHDFLIASDECYSEIYFDEDKPPPGLLQACAAMGRHNFHRCLVFHSLSKRSNLPGLRSGFVAGDAAILEKFLLYRTYQGCAMPVQHQLASIAAWRDENHVRENRAQYRVKFNNVLDILKDHLPVNRPQAGFYLWPQTPIPDTDFARQLFAQQNLRVLPGSFLARDTQTGNPGRNRVRLALVASPEECCEAAERIKCFLN